MKAETARDDEHRQIFVRKLEREQKERGRGGGEDAKRERLCDTMSISRLGHVEVVVKRLLGPKNCQFHALEKGVKAGSLAKS